MNDGAEWVSARRERTDPASWQPLGPLAFAAAANLACDLWLAELSGPVAIAARRQSRLEALVRVARERSRFYRELYAGVPATGWSIGDLPVTTKQALMARFDDVVTDPAVSKAAVDDFAADPRLIGTPLMGRFMVWRTSGTSGVPGTFVHDPQALMIYDALLWARGWPRFLSGWLAGARFGALAPAALIAADDGHYAAIASWRRLAQTYPWFCPREHILSVQSPLPELVAALNELAPAALMAYPSVLALLARERIAARLQNRPALLIAGGERLAPGDRTLIEGTFGSPVRNIYGASECDYIAFGCAQDWLHVNADWVVIEPVDSAFRPVPPGTPSYTTLVTNLANRLQPIIRYDLGDGITLRPDPCPCGSRLPAIRVDGRADDVLHLGTAAGGVVALSPMAVVSVLEPIPSLHRFQVIQTGATALAVRLDCERDSDPRAVWRLVHAALSRYLAAQGLGQVRVTEAKEKPALNPKSGKFQQITVDPAFADARRASPST